MKPGTRTLGVAESFAPDADRSTLAGAVVRADRVVDGFSWATCTVGGLDATHAVADCYRRLDREDVRYVLLSGVALAWYNVVELRELHELVDRPVIAVTYEESSGLESALAEAFDGPELEERRERYRGLPSRSRFEPAGETVFYRAVGIDDAEAETVLAAVSPEGGRPEPLRVARMAARAADDLRRSTVGRDGPGTGSASGRGDGAAGPGDPDT